ncbi:MAG: hypothetical protein CVV30_05855 [Methanomicrobiales archaeon HGW-Methanomicrobiales-1]|jgi:hypothetical protein|nr:MAG: hypothetical protein CVV30_05855 [Methanomicrobiales archaeon HGW-Methanomicrobiales-1]
MHPAAPKGAQRWINDEKMLKPKLPYRASDWAFGGDSSYYHGFFPFGRELSVHLHHDGTKKKPDGSFQNIFPFFCHKIP